MDASQAIDGGIIDAARALREHRVAVRDLVSCSLQRIDAVSGLNAYTDTYPDQALSLADAHQAMLDNGYDLGPLHGIPVAIKDNLDLAGTLTTAGSTILKDIPTTDAAVVSALKRAGAIIVGKNNMHELAWGGTTANPHFGTTRNAWDTGRSPSGSSGGSGSAVAARTVFAALGTDTGGSVRNPAAVSGVSGIRPTIGRVSNDGVFPLAWTLDTVGPLAKSSQDCALVLRAIAGHDPHDLQTSTELVPDYLAELERPLAGVRIGWIDDYSVDNVQPAVGSAFEAAGAVFESLGATVIAIRIPDLDAIVDALVILNAAEPSALHARWLCERGNEYGARVRAQLEAGLLLSATDYLQAQRYRTHIRTRFTETFRGVDAVLTPTLPFTAPMIGQDRIEINGRVHEIHTGNMRFTALASVPGLPALSVPMGFDADRLPIGLQIISPSFEEGRALRLGHQMQAVTDFHLQAPRSSSCGSMAGS